MNIFQRTILHQQPILLIIVVSINGTPINLLLHGSTIFRMRARKNHINVDCGGLVISKNPVSFR